MLWVSVGLGFFGLVQGFFTSKCTFMIVADAGGKILYSEVDSFSDKC